MLSGGRLHSPVHRVVLPEESRRASFVFFFYPKWVTATFTCSFTRCSQLSNVSHQLISCSEFCDICLSYANTLNYLTSCSGLLKITCIHTSACLFLPQVRCELHRGCSKSFGGQKQQWLREGGEGEGEGRQRRRARPREHDAGPRRARPHCFEGNVRGIHATEMVGRVFRRWGK